MMIFILVVLLVLWRVYVLQTRRIEYLEEFNKQTSTQILFHFTQTEDIAGKIGKDRRLRKEGRSSGLMSAFRCSTRHCEKMDGWVIPFDLKRYTRKFRR